MKRWWFMERAVVVLVAAVALGGCGEETPTGVGEDLLPPDIIETFEVVLDAEDFLVFDTAFGNYSDVAAATVGVLANDYRGAFDSRMLVRFELPVYITVLNDAGQSVQDSTPLFTGGELVLVVDSLVGDRDELISLNHATESWHQPSADWINRADTAGAPVPWSVPGGSPGTLIGESPVGTDSDTVTIILDEIDLAQWADRTNSGRGGILGVSTPGGRLRVNPPSLRVRATSDLQPDTVIELNLVATRTTVIYSPQQTVDFASELRVGGTPSWRGVLRMNERLDTVTVACPTTPGCRIPLSRAHISYAALLLQPTVVPDGRDPERSLSMTAHVLLPSPQIPLQRSPISAAVSGTRAGIPASSFAHPGAPLVELPLSDVIAAMTAERVDDGADRPSNITLVQVGTETFGYAAFAPQPRLRLILTITQELQLP